ncbi:MAG: hypothetical protein ACBR50_16970 [Microcoleus sp.]
MRVISRKRLKEFWETHPNAEISLLLWYQRSCDIASGCIGMI